VIQIIQTMVFGGEPLIAMPFPKSIARCDLDLIHSDLKI